MSRTSSNTNERTRLLNTSQQPYSTPEPGSDAHPKPHHNLAGLSPLKFRIVCISLWSCTFLASFDSTVVATLLSPIGSYFHASNQASWLGTAYLLSLCCFTPMYGRFSDLSRRVAFMTALFCFTLGTALCGVAPSMYTLIGARCVAGIGGGGIPSVSTIIMTDLVDLRHRGLYQGYANIFFGLGGALGGPVGGFVADKFGWRTAFLGQLPLLAIAAMMIYTQVRIPRAEAPAPPPGTSKAKEGAGWRAKLGRIDYLGSLFLVSSVATLLLAMSIKTSVQTSDGGDYRWSDPLIWGLLLTSAILTTTFILVEKYYAREPVLPLQLLTRRTPIAVAISSFTMVTNQFSILYNIPLYFSAVRLESASVSGAHLLPYSIMIGAGSLCAGWVMRKRGKYWWEGVTAACFMVLSAGLLLSWRKDSPGWITWVAQIPGGFGYAGVLTTTLVALMTHVQRAGKGETAVATSMTYLFRTTGQVMGVAYSAAVVQAVVASDLSRTITGPKAAEVIYLIRHSTSAIRTLPSDQRDAAVTAYEHALHMVFTSNLVLAVITVLALMLIEEEEMPDRKALVRDQRSAEAEE